MQYLLDHCLRQHTIVTSGYILDELHTHLVRKFKYEDGEADEAVRLLRERIEVVVPADVARPVCRDADDDRILGTAIAGSAVCIVSGDRDLLVLKRHADVDILSPAEFVAYEAARPDAG